MPPLTPADRPWPTTDPGLEAIAGDRLLQAHADVIDRIQLAFGLDSSSFAQQVLPAIRAYAVFVHLLPATATAHFSRPGGLCLLGLEVGFFALQGTDGHIFSGQSTISQRRALEPRWRLATFLGGLCCELHRAIASVVVTDEAGNTWPAYRMPLATWLQSHHISRYHLRWRPHTTEARGTALFALPHIVSAELLQELDEGNAVVVPHLLASIGGVPVYRELNVLDKLVRRALALVIDRDIARHAVYPNGVPDRHPSQPFGTHLEPYVVDTLRRLAATNTAWQPNRERSRVWQLEGDAYLAWPQAAADVLALLDADQLPGIPRSPGAMLDLLVAAGVALVNGDSRPVWRIALPGTAAIVESIKLASPALLWPDGAPRDASPQHAPPPNPATKRDAGQQLSLLEPAADTGQLPESPTPVASSSVPIALKAPMRLNAAIREGLAAIIDTLNRAPHEARAFTVSNGVFIPLVELERLGLQPAIVLRALTDLQLLASNPAASPRTITRDFGGSAQVGLVLDSRCITGLDAQPVVVPRAETA